MAIKKTFQELKDLDQLVAILYQKNKELPNTKFGYAYKRFVEKNYLPAAREFNADIEGVRIDSALEDPTTKALMTDEKDVRGYKYSKQGKKDVIAAEQKLIKEWNDKEIECVPYISVYVPEDLTQEEKEALTGILI